MLLSVIEGEMGGRRGGVGGHMGTVGGVGGGMEMRLERRTLIVRTVKGGGKMGGETEGGMQYRGRGIWGTSPQVLLLCVLY